MRRVILLNIPLHISKSQKFRERWREREGESKQRARVRESAHAGEQEGEGAQRVRERTWEKGTSERKPLRVLPFLQHPYQLSATQPRGPQATAAQVRWCHTATQTVSLKPKLGQKHLLWLTEAASQHLPHLSKSLRTPSLSFCQESLPDLQGLYSDITFQMQFPACRLGCFIKVHLSSIHIPIYVNYSFIRLYNISEMFQICI